MSRTLAPTHSGWRTQGRSATVVSAGTQRLVSAMQEMEVTGAPVRSARTQIGRHMMGRTYDNWRGLFVSAGQVARGWVVLAYDPIDTELHNYMQDAHDQGSVWMALPLLVLDCYEHAYMIQFGTDRNRYIETFMDIIDWTVVETRWLDISRNAAVRTPLTRPLPR